MPFAERMSSNASRTKGKVTKLQGSNNGAPKQSHMHNSTRLHFSKCPMKQHDILPQSQQRRPMGIRLSCKNDSTACGLTYPSALIVSMEPRSLETCLMCARHMKGADRTRQRQYSNPHTHAYSLTQSNT